MSQSVPQDNSKNEVLNPTIKRLGLVSFFTDVGSEMLYPITPIFLTSILGASMTSLGMIEGVAEGIASLLKTYSGAWSDRIKKRKLFIVIGYGLSGLSKPFIGLSTIWFQVLGARSLDKVGKGLRTAPRDALIAESVVAEKRGEAFGIHRAIDTFGAFVGPLIALLIIDRIPMREIFYWSIIPGIIAFIIATTIKEEKRNNVVESEKKTLRFFDVINIWKKTDINFKKYITALGIFALVNSSDVFLLMKAKSSGASTTLVILLFCLYNLVYALTSPFLGRLSDKQDRRYIMIFGILIYILVYAGFGYATETWQFVSLFMLYGIYMGANEGVSRALAVDLCPPEHKATSLGFLGTITGVSTIIASFVAGLLWDQAGSHWPFIYGSAGAFLTVLLLTQVKSKMTIS